MDSFMKRIIALASIFFSTVIFAIPPVILSTPSPAIAPTYNDNTSNIITYTITNHVPKTLPLAVSGISNGIQRATVSGDCGSSLPAGPSTCNIGINISPSSSQAGPTISQTLTIDYQGRAPLVKPPQTLPFKSRHQSSTATHKLPRCFVS